MGTKGLSTSRTLSSLKASQLKYITFLMGLPSTGTKAELESAIADAVNQPASPSGRHRVLSVDMGIRNLAFCTLDLPECRAKPWVIDIWKRMDLLEGISSVKEDIDPNRITTLAERKKHKSAILASVAKTAFTPSSLSKIAYNVTRELLSHNPDTILIERQRFRSGGAAAIQEWTVRVNMLESMIWACMQTLRETNGHIFKDTRRFPALIEVNPARVAQFWTSSSHLEAPEDLLNGMTDINSLPQERKKIEKNEKVSIVRRWTQGDKNVVTKFTDEATDIANAFKSNKKTAPGTMGKLDDLADCLLQAGAWVRWTENRRKIRNLIEMSNAEHRTKEDDNSTNVVARKSKSKND